MSLRLALVASFASVIYARLACDVCKETINEVDKWMATNMTEAKVEHLAEILCQADLAGGECSGPVKSWQCQQVCELAVKTYTSMTDYLLIRYIDPEFICYHIHNNSLKCPEPSPGPDPTPVPNIINDNQTRPFFNDSDRIGYFLQIPDLHWDPQYVAGSVANCGEPVCCRPYDNNHTYSDPVVYGGKYGIANESILCDTPLSVITSMLDYIADEIIVNNSDGINRKNLEFIAFVGDAMAHDVYNQSKEQHLEVMQKWTDMLHSTFDSFGIPVFLTMGNHEGLPVDNFNGPPTDDWFNEPVSQWIANWIDTPYSTELDTHKPSQILASSGYYSSVIRPGFRLIAVNTGYTESGNFYLKFTHWKDPYVDMGGQYKWLKATLYRAKHVLEEKVLILQHHPINSAIKQFERMYYELYEEYRDIIVTILAGHTHDDQFHVLGNDHFGDTLSENEPFATWFSSGSVTHYGGHNPAFRIFKYDRNTFDLENFYQYRFDTKRSNEEDKPYWFKAYDAKSEYGMKDISPSSMSRMAYEMATNDTLWKRFEVNHNNDVPISTALNRNATVCGSLTATAWQYDECRASLFTTDLTLDEYASLFW